MWGRVRLIKQHVCVRREQRTQCHVKMRLRCSISQTVLTCCASRPFNFSSNVARRSLSSRSIFRRSNKSVLLMHVGHTSAVLLTLSQTEQHTPWPTMCRKLGPSGAQTLSMNYIVSHILNTIMLLMVPCVHQVGSGKWATTLGTPCANNICT